MEYLSTRQAAARWGISTRRVVVLASQGRIDGAKQIDGRWLIPEWAAKPLPPESGGSAARPAQADGYVFPYLLGCVHSAAQVQAFTAEEKALYELCTVYETGDFAKSRALAEALLTCGNPYIRLGALYHLPTICMYLEDYAATERYSVLFRTACHDCTAHRAEIGLLLKGFDSEMVSVTGFAEALGTFDLTALSEETVPLAASWLLVAELAGLGTENPVPSFAAHELSCRMAERLGYFFDAMYMHIYLSLYYGATQAPEQERRHLRQALDIALEHGTLFTLSFSLLSNLEPALAVLRDYPPEVGAQIKALTDIFLRGRAGYAAYQGKTAISRKLREDDYRLISLCLKRCTITTMAEILGLSRSAVNKRLRCLYDKLGVPTKRELCRLYLKSMIDWGGRE